jgi:hypothetical protein
MSKIAVTQYCVPAVQFRKMRISSFGLAASSVSSCV